MQGLRNVTEHGGHSKLEGALLVGERARSVASGIGRSATAAPRPGRSDVRARAFRRLLLASSVSFVGDGVRVAALPLFTAVVTRNPLAVSAVAVAEVLPWLVVALPAGALVDRWRPRRVVVLANALRALLTGVLAAAVLLHAASLPLLVAVAFMVTSLETFADPASQMLLVELAEPDELDRANGRFVSAQTVGFDLAGPLVAAALFAWQPAACFGLDGLSFALAAIAVASLPDVVPGRDATVAPGRYWTLCRLWAQVVEGGRFLFGHAGLRVLVAAVVLAALAASAVNAVTALYAVEVLRMNPALVPTLFVGMAAGTIASAPLVPRLAARFGDGEVMVAALLVVAVGFGLLGAIPYPVAAWVAFGVIGIGLGCWNILSATRRQRATPSRLMGRVASTYRVLAWGLMPLGAGLAGPLALGTSLGTVFITAAAVVGAVAVLLARPLIRTGRGTDVRAEAMGQVAR